MGRISDSRWQTILPVLEKEKYLIQQCRQKDMPVHDHAFLELAYIVKGPVVHTLDQTTSVLQTGDYIIVDHGSVHSYRAESGEGFENIDLLFLPELVDFVLKGNISLRSVLEHYLLHFDMRALVQNPARTVFHDTDGEILSILKKIAKEDSERQPGYSEMVRSYVIQILLKTVRSLDGSKVFSAGHGITSYLTAYVAQHYREEVILSELAKNLNYTLPYVSKQFRQDMGISFVKYLQNYRVMEGCRLLASTKLTVSQIAEAVGYGDKKFFCDLVRRTTGYTPHAFRKLKS